MRHAVRIRRTGADLSQERTRLRVPQQPCPLGQSDVRAAWGEDGRDGCRLTSSTRYNYNYNNNYNKLEKLSNPNIYNSKNKDKLETFLVAIAIKL